MGKTQALDLKLTWLSGLLQPTSLNQAKRFRPKIVDALRATASLVGYAYLSFSFEADIGLRQQLNLHTGS